MTRPAALTLFVMSLIMSSGTPAAADVEVQFTDRRGGSFIIANTGACSLRDSTIEIDLGSSIGGVFFDVSEASPGYGRSIPFRLFFGADYLEDFSDIKDGDTSIILKVKTLPSGAFIGFSADTDYEKEGSGAYTNTSFVKGGLVRISNSDKESFDEDGYAFVPVGDCFS